MSFFLTPRKVIWVFIGYPPGVHRIHIYSKLSQLRGRCVGHHVKSSFRHVGMGMAGRFMKPVKLSFHCCYIYYMFAAGVFFFHKVNQPVVENERSHQIYQLHLNHLCGFNFPQVKPPAIGFPQIYLLKVGI